MSPLTGGTSECPHLIQDDTFYFCAIHETKPKKCANHQFPASVCPIGKCTLKITAVEEVHKRIDDGWDKIKGLAK